MYDTKPSCSDDRAESGRVAPCPPPALSLGARDATIAGVATTGAAMRAVHAASILRGAEDLVPEAYVEFERRVTSRRIEAVRALRGMEWVAMEDHMALSDALRDIIGPDRFRDLFRRGFRHTLDHPLLQGMVGLLRAFPERSVPLMLRNSARLYGHITRSVGTLACEGVGVDHATLRMTGWPSDRFSFECWLDGMQGVILGAAEAFAPEHDRVVVEVVDTDAQRGDATFGVWW